MQVDEHARVVDAIIDRTRTRNRGAQIRFRQRKQEEADALAQRIDAARSAVKAARERHSQLLKTQVACSTRATNAASALAQARAQRARRPQPAAHASGTGPSALPSVSATFAAARALLDWETHTPAAPSRPDSPPVASGSHARSRARRPGAPHAPASLVHSKRGRRRTLQQPAYATPRQIPTFRACSGISFADLRAAADPAARLIDFSQHTLAEVMDRVYTAKAAALQLPRGDVCWFVQTLYEVSEGAPLSMSASLCSPECLASFVLFGILSRLELTLIKAAAAEVHTSDADAQVRRLSHSIETAAAVEDVPPPKAPRPPPQPPARAASPDAHAGSTMATGAPARTHETAQHTARAASVAAHSAHEHEVPAWSGCVRVGTGGVAGAGAAVRTMLHCLLRGFCRAVPSTTLCRMLSSFHEIIAEMQKDLSAARWKAGGLGAAQIAPGGTSNGEDVRLFMASIMAAGRGVVKVMVDALDCMADMRVLRELEAEGPWACSARGVVRPEGGLESYAHVAASVNASVHCGVQQAAPRIAANISFFSVRALSSIRLDVEADTFHIHLYRQLRLTEDDRARLVAHWAMWSQVSRTLNAPFHSALSTLRSLPEPGDIPAALLARVHAVADGEMHEPHASGDCKGGVEWGVLRLLGLCAEDTAAAVRGMHDMREVHEAHGRFRRETLEVQMTPGAVLTPLQLVRVGSAQLSRNVAQADMMKLCQLAASQQQWRDLATRSTPQPPPLPRYQWFTNDAAADVLEQ